MNDLQIYNIFQELTSSYINNYLDEELGLYIDCIEPINNELHDSKDTQSDVRINIILRLILWDKLFYKKFEFEESKILGSYRRKAFIDALFPIIHNPEIYTKSHNMLVGIFSRWPQIRDFIFRPQKNKLDKCNSSDDFLSFADSSPYLEYALYAKYRISQLNNTPFIEAKIAIENFPQSDLLPINQLKSLFQEVNGIHFMWKGIASESDNNIGIKEVIMDIISNSKPSNTNDEYFLHNLPIDYYLLRRILSSLTEASNEKSLNYELYLHDCQKKENNDKIAIISSKEFFFSLISMLNDVVSGINFSLPKVGMIPIEKYTSTEYLWAEFPDNSMKQVVIRCKDGKIFPDSKGLYAGCILMLDT
jgi:hypothetical protein